MEQYNSKKNVKKKYQIRAVVVLLIYIFLFSSKWIFGGSSESPMIEKGTQYEQADTIVTYVHSDYSSKSREFIFVFSLDLSTVNPLYDYSVSAKADKKTSADLPVEIEKISEDKYVAVIKELPKKWKKMSIEVVAKNGKELLQSSNGLFLFESIWYADSDKELEKNTTVYLPYFVEVKVQNIEKEIKEKEKEIKELESQNKKLEVSIKQFKESKETAVGEEVEQLDNQITLSESNLQSNKEQINQANESIKNNKDKIELIEKNAD